MQRKQGAKASESRNQAGTGPGESGAPQAKPGGRPQGRQQQRVGNDALELPVYTSMTRFVEATGCPMPVLKQLRDAGNPGFIAGRIHLGTFLRSLAWQSLLRKPEQGELPIGAPTGSFRSELDKWNAENAKVRALRAMNKVADRQEVLNGIAAASAEFWNMADRIFCSELPPVLRGLEAADIREKNAAALDQLKKENRERLKKCVAIPETDEIADAEEEMEASTKEEKK